MRLVLPFADKGFGKGAALLLSKRAFPGSRRLLLFFASSLVFFIGSRLLATFAVWPFLIASFLIWAFLIAIQVQVQVKIHLVRSAAFALGLFHQVEDAPRTQDQSSFHQSGSCALQDVFDQLLI